jgi:hypothetical protein
MAEVFAVNGSSLGRTGLASSIRAKLFPILPVRFIQGKRQNSVVIAFTWIRVVENPSCGEASDSGGMGHSNGEAFGVECRALRAQGGRPRNCGAVREGAHYEKFGASWLDGNWAMGGE